MFLRQVYTHLVHASIVLRFKWFIIPSAWELLPSSHPSPPVCYKVCMLQKSDLIMLPFYTKALFICSQLLQYYFLTNLVKIPVLGTCNFMCYFFIIPFACVNPFSILPAVAIVTSVSLPSYLSCYCGQHSYLHSKVRRFCVQCGVIANL